MTKNYLRSKYFKRILLLIFLASIVPALLLSSFSFKLTSIYSNNFYEMHKSIIVNQKKRVEDTLKSTEYSMIQFMSLPEVTKIIKMPREAQYFQDFTNVSTNLFRLQSPRLDIDDLILVSFDKNWVLSNNSFTDIESSSYEHVIARFLESPYTSFWYSSQKDDNIYIVKKLPLSSIKSNGMLLLRIKKSAIENIITDENENYPVTIINEDGEGIIGTKANLEIAQYAQSLAESSQTVLSGGIVQFTYKGKDYSLTSSRSEYNNWIYISIVLSSQLNKGINNLYIFMMVLICSIVIGIIIFSFTFSRSLYQPIDNLNQAMNSEIMASNKEAVELCMEENPNKKLNYILLSIGELRKHISTQKESEISNFLQKVYTGNYSELEAEEFIQNGITNIQLNECYMYTIGIKYVDVFTDKKDSDLYIFALQNVIEEIFPSAESFLPVSINDIVYTTYYKKAPSEIGIQIYLKNLCESLLLLIEKYLNKKICVGISGCFSNIQNFADAVDESNMALRICVQKYNSIEFYAAEKNNQLLYPDSKLNIRRMKIIQSVTNGDMEMGKAEIDEYFVELRRINYYLFKLEINKLLSDILTCMNSSSIMVDCSLVGKVTSFDITNSLNSIEELKKFLWDNFLKPLYKKAVEPPETETADTLQEIIKYLNENIENNISLDQCAEYFKYNPNYLSRMFKNHFGKTFTDYIIDLKVKLSKQLLLTTDLSVNDIAARLGYNNAQNFIRVFKKNVLLTPGQFRSKNQEN